jgi:hypothetical protein
MDDIFVAQKQGVCVRRTKPLLSQIEEDEEEEEEEALKEPFGWLFEEDLDILFRGCFYDSRELLEELFEELFGDF